MVGYCCSHLSLLSPDGHIQMCYGVCCISPWIHMIYAHLPTKTSVRLTNCSCTNFYPESEFMSLINGYPWSLQGLHILSGPGSSILPLRPRHGNIHSPSRGILPALEAHHLHLPSSTWAVEICQMAFFSCPSTLRLACHLGLWRRQR